MSHEMGPWECALPVETSDIEERVSDDEDGVSFRNRNRRETRIAELQDASDVMEK
jgi:hypothetical protein